MTLYKIVELVVGAISRECVPYVAVKQKTEIAKSGHSWVVAIGYNILFRKNSENSGTLDMISM